MSDGEWPGEKKPWEELESARCIERHRPRFTKLIWNQLLNILCLSIQNLPFNPTCNPFFEDFVNFSGASSLFTYKCTWGSQTQTGLVHWAATKASASFEGHEARFKYIDTTSKTGRLVFNTSIRARLKIRRPAGEVWVGVWFGGVFRGYDSEYDSGVWFGNIKLPFSTCMNLCKTNLNLLEKCCCQSVLCALEPACCWRCSCCCQSGVCNLERACLCRWNAAARCWCRVLLAVTMLGAVWSGHAGAGGRCCLKVLSS